MTSIEEKADYVRAELRAGRPTSHECHWPGCGQTVPAAAWGCKKHWFILPQRFRNRIWCAFRPGQEASKTPSREYVEVAREVQDWIAKFTSGGQNGR